jgi:hypothetical protein
MENNSCLLWTAENMSMIILEGLNFPPFFHQ